MNMNNGNKGNMDKDKVDDRNKDKNKDKKQIKLYQIKHKQYKRTIDSQIILQIKQAYQAYKQKLPLPSEKKDINQILFNLTIKIIQIENITSQNRKNWENQIQIIQWTKYRAKQTYSIYYDYKSKECNIFVILNLATLIKQGKIYINCTQKVKQIIEINTHKFNIHNIKYLDDKKQKQEQQNTYNLYITDNLHKLQQITIKKKPTTSSSQYTPYFQSPYKLPPNQYILASFNSSNPYSTQLMYNLYVHFYIRKVGIYPSVYYGYTLYSHFFQYSQNPTGLFQLQNIQYIIWIYWSNSVQNLINQTNRYQNLKQIIRVNSPQVQVKVITSLLLQYFELKQQSPFHPGFYHLSPTHRSDYVRGYMMNFYGGGYADIKHIQFKWLKYFIQLQKSSQNIYAIGYKQMSPGDVSCYQIQGKQPCRNIRKYYQQLIGNGQYIYKRLNKISKQWVIRMDDMLQRHYQQLNKIPKEYGTNPNYREIKNIPNYPLRWGQMGGSIIQRIQYQNLGHVYLDFPYVIMKDYK